MARLTRIEQRDRTRQQLLDATVVCLTQYGFAGATTQRIQDEVGISRGALLHHFESKSELFVAVIRYLARRRLEQLETLTRTLEGQPDALRQMVDAIRELVSGLHFQATHELWAAARTDAVLRKALLPAERRVGAALRAVFDRHSGITDPQASRTRFESLMALVRGLELTRMMRPDAGMIEQVIEDWIQRVPRSTISNARSR